MKKMKKGIFWGVIIASILLLMKVLHFIFGSHRGFAEGRHGHGPGGMGQPGGMGPGMGGGFGGSQFMNGGPHHGEGVDFPWLGLLIGLALIFFLVRWLRKRTKTSSMKQFINTPIVDSHIPAVNQNAQILDQWEKNLIKKKENE